MPLIKKIFLNISVVCLAAFASTTVMACACCSYRDTWDTTTIKPKTYAWEVFESLTLDAGNIRTFECEECEEPKLFAVTKVSRAGLVFHFKTAKGDFVFRAEPTIELKRADMDFNEGETSQADSFIPIYHEIVLRGQLTLPATAAKPFGSKPQRAHLILRGMGLNCLESGVFQNWLLRVDTQNHQLSGSGPIKHPEKPI